MTSPILACVDGSPVGTAVCDYASWASLTLGAPLKFLHVIEKSHTPAMDDLSGAIGLGGRELLLKELSELDARRHIVAIEHGKAILADASQRAQKMGVTEIDKSQRHDRLVGALLAEQDQSQLIVMGQQGNDTSMDAIGSQVENVVRAVHTPILMAAGAFAKPTKFMVAYDGSASADQAIAAMTASPLRSLLEGLEGHVVMVGNEDADNQDKLGGIQRIFEAAGIKAKTHLVVGEVVKSLQRFQQQNGIELTVMGAYGHARITEFFVGSNTSQMLAASQGPVLIMRG